MTRIKSITTLNYVMTCIIVLYHCHVSVHPVSLLDEQISGDITLFFSQLTAVAMSFFFFITAFLLFRNLTIKNYTSKIKNAFFHY